MKKTNSETPLMTISRYAAHRAVSRQYAAKLARNGTLIMHGHLVDVVASDRILDDRPDIGQRATNRATDASFAQARTVEMVFRAKLRRLEYERRQAQLIERELVRHRLDQHLTTLREGLWALVDRLAPDVATESGPKRVHDLLKTALVEELTRLGDLIGSKGTEAPDTDLHRA